MCAPPVLLLALLALMLSAVPDVSAQSGLSGVVRDSVRGTPLPNVQILLSKDTTSPRWDSLPPRFHLLTDAQGGFRFADIPAGKYALRARFIGYKSVGLPVKIQLGKENFVAVYMSGTSVCLGHCEPDPIKLAYARSHRDEWSCQLADPKAIESARRSWIRRLAEDTLPLPDSAGVPPQLPRDSAQLERKIRHVTDRARCRRAGRVYDQEFGATDTRFLVYEGGPFLFVSNSWGSDDLVLDRAYRVLIRYIVE
jgi:hypothetical protein